METRRSIAIVQPIGLMQRLSRLIAAVHVLQGQPKVDVNIRRFHTQLDGLHERLDSLRRPPFVTQQFAIQGDGLRQVGPERHQSIKLDPRPVLLFRSEKRQRQVETRIDIPLIEHHRHTIRRSRFVPAAKRRQHHPIIVVVRGMGRIKSKQFLHQRYRFLGSPSPVADLGQQVQRLFILPVGRQQSPRNLFGLRQVSRSKAGNQPIDLLLSIGNHIPIHRPTHNWSSFRRQSLAGRRDFSHELPFEQEHSNKVIFP